MARYIDAEKLDEYKFSYVTNERYVSDGGRKSEEEVYAYKVGYNEAIADIAQFAPTADVVEVVRCKDCKHREGSACDYSTVWVRENWFCADGERKETEDAGQML